jgi:uncharacterized membrane protein
MSAFPASLRSPFGASLVLGLALGGFFDGILLHQVLEWHHLLSNLDAVSDLRTQILADGLFHLLMFVLAVGALLALGRRWGATGHESGGRTLLAGALYGFALWHVIDAVAFHWLMGLHRVRVDVPDPLFWDLLWLAVFGAVPFLIAHWLRRKPPGGSGRRVTAGLGVLVLGGGIASAWPASDSSDEAMVLFLPGISPVHAFEALARMDARVRWVDGGGGVWAVQWSRRPSALELLREGAVLAGGTALGLGCVGSMRLAERGEGSALKTAAQQPDAAVRVLQQRAVDDDDVAAPADRQFGDQQPLAAPVEAAPRVPAVRHH